MRNVVRPGSQEEQVGRLILAGALVVLLPGLPLGNYLIYPFAILTTWFHEMGHGLAAMALGYDFERLVLLPDGSGFAESSSATRRSALSQALISAGGPLGPSVVGSGLILATRWQRYWRPVLYGLATLITASTLIWVDGWTGWIVMPLVASTLVALALKGRDWLIRFCIQFLGILAALSMFQNWNYLFSYSAIVGGQEMLSDTGAMQEALWLPYWIWAILIIALSGLMIGASLKYALEEDGAPPDRSPH